MSNNNTIEEMWTELQSYQPFADANGHGDTWRTMCEKRTKEAALRAADAARPLNRRTRREWPWLAALAASTAADCDAYKAIMNIRKAKELQQKKSKR
jgi:hypothetical protein